MIECLILSLWIKNLCSIFGWLYLADGGLRNLGVLFNPDMSPNKNQLKHLKANFLTFCMEQPAIKFAGLGCSWECNIGLKVSCVKVTFCELLPKMFQVCLIAPLPAFHILGLQFESRPRTRALLLDWVFSPYLIAWFFSIWDFSSHIWTDISSSSSLHWCLKDQGLQCNRHFEVPWFHYQKCRTVILIFSDVLLLVPV